MTPAVAVSSSAEAWGNNFSGQLGDGTATSRSTPVAVSMPAGVTFSAIAAGAAGDHSLALDSSGRAWAWGFNEFGELGEGTTTGRTTPVAVSMPAGVMFSAIAAGGNHSLALDTSGRAWAWGNNSRGQLGNGPLDGNPHPTPVQVSMPTGVTLTAIAGGQWHSLALDSSGRACAWGQNFNGELGCVPGGSGDYIPTPVAVSMPAGRTFSAIAGGGAHSLALDNTGQAWAWGFGKSGAHGDGIHTGPYNPTPVAVSMPAGITFTIIAGGFVHVLALDSSGRAWAWGDNISGDLGDGTTTMRTTPAAVSMPAGVTFSAIAGGGYGGHSLALDSSGHAWGWGANFYGQVGDGTSGNGNDRTTPVAVRMPAEATFSAIAAGYSHSLALGPPAVGPSSGISLAPATATNPVGGSHTVTVAVADIGGNPVSGVTVTFTVQSGPNAGKTGTAITDASGHASFTYTDTGGAGSDSIAASFTDSSGTVHRSKTVNKTWTVVEQPISAQGTTFSATEGQSFSGSVATFCDPDVASTSAEYSATIDWGDGTSSSGTISATGKSSCGNTFTVDSTHMYAEEATYTVKPTITDKDDASNSATVTSTAKVGDAALSSTCAMLSTIPQSFTGPTVKFNDESSTGTLSDFSATISWGEGSTSAGTITGGPGFAPYIVSGSHTYTSTGRFTVTTSIKDVGGSTTTGSCSVLVFAFAPGGGSFVVGDKNAAVGNSVSFWGAQWWKDNQLSGGSAPASFKGFAENPATPSCGTGWSADPGNSTPPPEGPLPAYMGVLVTSHADKSGSAISGDTVEIIVVKTDPGYQPNPGHAGTGTVVADACKT